MKCLLNRADQVLVAAQPVVPQSGDNPAYQPDEGERDKGEEREEREDRTSLQLNLCAGVMDRARVLAFEKMLWRVSKGNVYTKFADIEEELKACDKKVVPFYCYYFLHMQDPKTGDNLIKSVFIIFYQGEALRKTVRKICDGFHCSVYPVSHSAQERRAALLQAETRCGDHCESNCGRWRCAGCLTCWRCWAGPASSGPGSSPRLPQLYAPTPSGSGK